LFERSDFETHLIFVEIEVDFLLCCHVLIVFQIYEMSGCINLLSYVKYKYFLAMFMVFPIFMK
jgi:hypothetical protein